MNIITKTIHEVGFCELDKSISAFLKSKEAKDCEFELVDRHELMNGIAKDFSVGQYAWSKVTQSEKQSILDGNLDYQAGTILNWMHEEGLIPAGEYFVDVSW